jgi:hypothetical protein
MTVSLEQYYRKLYRSCGDVLSQSFRFDEAGLHAVAHHFVQDLNRWYDVLKARPESRLLLASLSEYQFALLAVVLGQYRQSFMSLRLSFELALGAVHFSANELKLRQWIKGRHDLVWAALVDADSGVFSKPFITVFYEDLADSGREYGAIAESVYRECSEYVHGNASTQSSRGEKVEFQRDSFLAWHEKAKAVRLASSFALCARYVELLSPPERALLEQVLLDNLGHLSAVRAILGAPVEQIDD